MPKLTSGIPKRFENSVKTGFPCHFSTHVRIWHCWCQNLTWRSHTVWFFCSAPMPFPDIPNFKRFETGVKPGLYTVSKPFKIRKWHVRTGMPFRSNGVKTSLKPDSKPFENGVKTCSVNTPFQNGVKTRLKPVSTPFNVRIWHCWCQNLTLHVRIWHCAMWDSECHAGYRHELIAGDI